jgi:DnaJ family protein C protein 7
VLACVGGASCPSSSYIELTNAIELLPCCLITCPDEYTLDRPQANYTEKPSSWIPKNRHIIPIALLPQVGFQAVIALSEQSTKITFQSPLTVALKRFKTALADCQKAAALQSASPQAKTLARLARCQIALGQIDDAQRTLSEVLSLDPSNAQAATDQAKIDKIRNDLTSIERSRAKKDWTFVMFGLDSLEKEVEMPPTHWRVLRVEALLGKKRTEDAASLASDLLRINQNDPDVLWVRGLALFAQGNTAQAVAHAQAALRNDPDHSAAK